MWPVLLGLGTLGLLLASTKKKTPSMTDVVQAKIDRDVYQTQAAAPSLPQRIWESLPSVPAAAPAPKPARDWSPSPVATVVPGRPPSSGRVTLAELSYSDKLGLIADGARNWRGEWPPTASYDSWTVDQKAQFWIDRG